MENQKCYVKHFEYNSQYIEINTSRILSQPQPCPDRLTLVLLLKFAFKSWKNKHNVCIIEKVGIERCSYGGVELRVKLQAILGVVQ